MEKKVLGGIGGGVAVVALTAATLFATVGFPQPVPTPTPTAVVSLFDLNGYAEGPPKPTPEPVAPAQEVPVAEELPAEPSGPVLCPPGSQANSSDGYNDTSCFPELCFSISVPDPAHPECDVAFRP